jgi:hypothetical protein
MTPVITSASAAAETLARDARRRCESGRAGARPARQLRSPPTSAPLALADDIERVVGAHEAGDKGTCRLLKDRLRRIDLHDAPGIDHGDAIGERQRFSRSCVT